MQRGEDELALIEQMVERGERVESRLAQPHLFTGHLAAAASTASSVTLSGGTERSLLLLLLLLLFG